MLTRSLSIVLLLCCPFAALAQSNFSGFNYQAVVRTASGDPVANQTVGVRVQINPGLSQGYAETHAVTTDAHGQIALVLGEGTPEVGSSIPTFAAINWNNGDVMNYSISVDITGGTNYVALSAGQFKSVPFALRALSSGGGGATGWSLVDNDQSNTNSGNVGIGTTTPTSKLTVRTASNSANARVASLANAIGDPLFELVANRGETGNGFGAVTTQFGQSYNGSPIREGLRFHRGGGGDDGSLSLITYGDERMRITSGGNVGINTSTPQAQLDIRNSGTSELRTSISNGYYGSMRFNGSEGLVLQSVETGVTFRPIQLAGNELVFNSGAGTLAERMRINSAGNIGIGTSSPSNKLSVLGTADFNGNVGIGTTSPQAQLEVLNSGGSEIRASISSTHWGQFYFDGGGLSITAINQGQEFRPIYVNGKEIVFNTGGGTISERMRISSNGNVGIGTSNPQSMLAVNGKITCKEVEVTLAGFPDYVFERDYRLMPLVEVDAYIKANGHLPNVPSACDVEENGLGLGEMNKILLEKVEELTLHLIGKEKELKALAAESASQRALLEELMSKAR